MILEKEINGKIHTQNLKDSSKYFILGQLKQGWKVAGNSTKSNVSNVTKNPSLTKPIVSGVKSARAVVKPIIKSEVIKEVVADEVATVKKPEVNSELEDLKEAYTEKFRRAVPIKYSKNIEWLKSKLV